MATKGLTTNYLTKLTNANHDGVTQQICDRLRDFETENQMLNLPETEPIRRKAQTGQAGVQGLPVLDHRRLRGRGAQGAKHAQQWTATTEYELTERGGLGGTK